MSQPNGAHTMNIIWDAIAMFGGECSKHLSTQARAKMWLTGVAVLASMYGLPYLAYLLGV
jgi:hypothetical protein